MRVLQDGDGGRCWPTGAIVETLREVPFTGADNGGLIEQTSRPDPALAEQFAAPAARIYESREGARQAILPDSGFSSHRVSGESSDCVPGAGVAESPAEVSGDTRVIRAGRLACATEGFDLDCDGVTGDSDPGTEGSILSLGCIDMFMVQDNNRCLRAIFDVVAASGQFNFRAARIPLPSALRLSRWRSVLKGYRDYHIVEYLEFGWPIGINRDALLWSQLGNHPSALAHQGDVDHYVAMELAHRVLLGLFDGPPGSSCHFSPLMTRPKKGSRFRRVIVDLSWPKGYSVNDGISRVDYIDGPMTISLPTPDEMERAVVRAGRGSFLYKTDLSRGYRQIRVDPLTGRTCHSGICPSSTWTYAPRLASALQPW